MFEEDDLWESAPDAQVTNLDEDTDDVYRSDEDDSIFDETSDKTEQPNEEPKESGDYLERYLRYRNIDKNKIRIINANNEEEDVKFDNLSDDEKLDILETANTPIISDSEINTLNFLRQHNITDLNEFTEAVRNQTLSEIQTPQVSSVDEISDDDLYIFDLADRYGFDIDKDKDVILEMVNRDKENPALYQRKVDALRAEYKQLEVNQQEQAKQDAEIERQQQWVEMRDGLVQVARNTNVINGLELDNQDKNEILSCILSQDPVTGQTDFYKFYSDPEMMFKMAWYALKGDEAFRTVENYYKGKLAEARRGAKNTVVTRSRV